jgi:thioredoxin reductase
LGHSPSLRLFGSVQVIVDTFDLIHLIVWPPRHCHPFEMRFFIVSLLISSILSQTTAAPLESRNDTITVWDAIIVGGGPAGLAALSSLARVRRNVLLIDSGEYRNAPTRHMHDVLGFDGVKPAYYRWAARGQISHYETVSMTNGTVTKIEPQPEDDGATYFKVSATFPDSRGDATLWTRKVVLATGIRDRLPNTPGIAENFGHGVFWCPWCDGIEHYDEPLGLLASLDKIAGLVREMVTLNTDVVAFVNGTDTPEVRAAAEESFPDWQRYLTLHNVTIENATLKSITRLRDGEPDDRDPSLPTMLEHDLFRVNFVEDSNQEPVERGAFLVSAPTEQRSDLGEETGVQLYGNGRLAVDDSKGSLTNIPGVYAVGDANSDNSTNVYHALYSGKHAAVFIHVQLARESAKAELAADGAEIDKRSENEMVRSLWDEMNGEPHEILYAGKLRE